MKLGVRMESLGLPFRPALAAAAKLGAAGVQLDAVGDLSPDRLSDTGRKEVRHLLGSYGLELSAVGCPMRHRLDDPTNFQSRIERLKKALALSFDLGPRKIVIDAGGLPVRAEDPRKPAMAEALTDLGSHASRIGATLALESGLESGEALAGYLSQFTVGGLGVNYDPANMMVHGLDAVTNLAPLKGFIVHTHARDIRRAGAARGAIDVPIGHGDIEWISYIATLSAIEFDGWMTVETDSPNAAMVEQGIRFLRQLA